MQGPIAAVGMVAGAFKNLMGKAKEYEAGWAIQEEAIALLESTLKATGATAWTSSEAIQAMASEFQSFTKYGDETILTMQGVLLGFKKYKRRQLRGSQFTNPKHGNGHENGFIKCSASGWKSP